MFYIASRIFWFLFSPVSVLAFLTLAGVAALFTRFARSGRYLLAGIVVIDVLCGFGPVGAILVRPLEDRFPRPPEPIAAPTGIIVLGGGLRSELTAVRGVTALAESGGRLTQAALLARRFPGARVVYAGGPEDPSGAGRDEAHAAARFLTGLGIEESRIELEMRSLNTEQNANFTRELVEPEPGQTWLLVTSAAHIPRAMGAFRQAGFNVVAYPTDYLTLGSSFDYWSIHADPSEGLSMLNIAVHEWLGLLAYRITGRADELLPGP